MIILVWMRFLKWTVGVGGDHSRPGYAYQLVETIVGAGFGYSVRSRLG